MTEQEQKALRRTLQDYAHDSSLEIISYTSESLDLLVTLDARVDKKHVIRFLNPCFLVMPPSGILHKMEFGDINLLPNNFIETHFSCFDWEGREEDLRVAKIDIDDNIFYALYWGRECFY